MATLRHPGIRQGSRIVSSQNWGRRRRWRRWHRSQTSIFLSDFFVPDFSNFSHCSTMVRGSSQSQSSSSSTSRPGLIGMAPRGTAAATAGMRRRHLAGSSGGGSGRFNAGGGNGSNVLRFYTDDTPGLKISPTVVLVMSLCFIGFVTALNVFGKLYRYRSGPAA